MKDDYIMWSTIDVKREITELRAKKVLFYAISMMHASALFFDIRVYGMVKQA